MTGPCPEEAWVQRSGETAIRRVYLLIDIWVNISYEKVGAHIHGLLILAGLVDADGLAIHLNHVQYLDGLHSSIFSVGLG